MLLELLYLSLLRPRFLKVVSLSFSCLIAPLADNGSISRAETIEPTITVSGEAEVRVIPDEVFITAGVLTRAKQVTDGSQENDAKVKSLRQFLKAQGIEDRHITTTYMQISTIEPPQDRPWEGKGSAQTNIQNSRQLDDNPFDGMAEPSNELAVPQPIGYQVNRTFSILITDISKFESIYKGIIGQGVNTVSQVEFRTSQLRTHRDQARLMAVKAAREKATAMAEQLEAKLASVRTVVEYGNRGFAGRAFQSNATHDPFGTDDAPSYTPGQISIIAAVEVLFVLKDVGL